MRPLSLYSVYRGDDGVGRMSCELQTPKMEKS